MARIEWVQQRLENWALWHEREGGGSLGFASQSSFLNEAAETSRYRESVVPVDDVDAGITNDAVESMKPERDHLYRTLHLVYLKGTGIKETARLLAKAESTVHAQLGQADAYLSQWFIERKRRQTEQQAERQRAEALARRVR
jgi:hypothetical protein